MTGTDYITIFRILRVFFEDQCLFSALAKVSAAAGSIPLASQYFLVWLSASATGIKQLYSIVATGSVFPCPAGSDPVPPSPPVS